MEDDELDFENFDYGDIGDFDVNDFDVEAMDKELGLDSPLPTKLEITKPSSTSNNSTTNPISSTANTNFGSSTTTTTTTTTAAATAAAQTGTGTGTGIIKTTIGTGVGPKTTKPSESVSLSKATLTDSNKKEDGEVENTNGKGRPMSSMRESTGRPNYQRPMAPMARNNHMMPMNPYGVPMMNYSARPAHRIHVNPKFAGAIPMQSTIPIHSDPHRMQRERELDEQRKRLVEAQRKRQNERQQFHQQEPQDGHRLQEKRRMGQYAPENRAPFNPPHTEMIDLPSPQSPPHITHASRSEPRPTMGLSIKGSAAAAAKAAASGVRGKATGRRGSSNHSNGDIDTSMVIDSPKHVSPSTTGHNSNNSNAGSGLVTNHRTQDRRPQDPADTAASQNIRKLMHQVTGRSAHEINNQHQHQHHNQQHPSTNTNHINKTSRPLKSSTSPSPPSSSLSSNHNKNSRPAITTRISDHSNSRHLDSSKPSQSTANSGSNTQRSKLKISNLSNNVTEADIRSMPQSGGIENLQLDSSSQTAILTFNSKDAAVIFRRQNNNVCLVCLIFSKLTICIGVFFVV
ncbi:hypothetical protein PHYBLDRAFT_170183 [Phycomyces blakesleeanus NRRL 1555(-)]|uniref:RRM domain-containing protein n=1 Tax=Phycomyces blakesleeanus (strain ATCC 8743b / DSM 1359 / FGSC 10004 / NBRC 33097 / NRRL 1555) TaxID=763407 RepID=A0A167M1E0_PHYB8|nr:hypothetical protein PHYBLDRAFT_170183 [Phycomyces blakesleeanus NRRL 1555(-)]OAD71514.1 hypothetical protein PHYBLDRAFT_170183 [Phycomyces blakesleeanus NRRL 1555(-)]|eukprot:XP_018289554.1 hypothetical protein PHYBLDRAFT_170183 [Phycomyces blakesleeanus NRRL 1555(-)]